MVRQAGFWKRLKNGLQTVKKAIGKGIGKTLSGVGKFVNRMTETFKPALHLIPVVGPAIGEVLERGSRTADKLGQTIYNVNDGKARNYQWKQFGNYLKDEYKSSPLIAPVRMYEAGKEGGLRGIANEVHAQIKDGMDFIDFD